MKSNFKLILTTLFSIFISISISQINSNYIEIIENNVTFGVNLGGIQNHFTLTNDKKNYLLNSNISPILGLWFKYKKLPAIGIGIPYGRSKNDSIANSNGIKINLNTQLIKGLLIEGDFFYLNGLNLYTSKNRLIKKVPNAFDLNTNLKFIYFFNNKKFSYKSAYLFGEKQIKSSGSTTLEVSGGFLMLKPKAPLFTDLNNEANFKQISSLSFSMLGGYIYTHVFGKQDKWFMNGGLFMGPNLHSGKINFYNSNNYFSNLSLAIKYKLAIGYKAEKFYFRFFGMGNFIDYKPTPKLKLQNRVLSFKIETFYRFKK